MAVSVVLVLGRAAAEAHGAGLRLPPRRRGLACDRGPLLGGELLGVSSGALEPAGVAARGALGRGGLLGIADGLGDDLMRELVRVARALEFASEHGVGRSQDQAWGSTPGWISN